MQPITGPFADINSGGADGDALITVDAIAEFIKALAAFLNLSPRLSMILIR
jgi:hypothetical protein